MVHLTVVANTFFFSDSRLNIWNTTISLWKVPPPIVSVLLLNYLTQLNQSIMQLNAIMKENNWALHPSPMDGHCLLHSTVTSYDSQLPDSPKLLLSSLIEKIVLHVNSHLSDYTIFGLSVPKILLQLNKYIHERKYTILTSAILCP